MAYDLEALRALTSTPLIRMITSRVDDAANPLVNFGHAVRDEFTPAGRDLEEAMKAAQVMTKESRSIYQSSADARRATGIIRTSDGEYFLVGINGDAWDGTQAGRGVLELRKGIIGRVGDEDVRRPSMLTNQATAPDVQIEGPFDTNFVDPQIEAIVPELVAVVSSTKSRIFTQPGEVWKVPMAKQDVLTAP